MGAEVGEVEALLDEEGGEGPGDAEEEDELGQESRVLLRLQGLQWDGRRRAEDPAGPLSFDRGREGRGRKEGLVDGERGPSVGGAEEGEGADEGRPGLGLGQPGEEVGVEAGVVDAALGLPQPAAARAGPRQVLHYAPHQPQLQMSPG